ncbi:putative RNA-binding protein CG14230 [Xylocopa sonorina]|uniref:putative RNA-binding protein CG14230 n=1 Tax=Xylocopa sonorina TaxID=1818115 RepID=UPI00403AD6F6
MDGISISEQKRLESVKYKKQVFKAKEWAVQNALRNLDNKSNENKIIFDDNIDQVEQPQSNTKKRKARNLFDDNDELAWDDSKFAIDEIITGKSSKRNVTLGNDERFKLNEHFLEDDKRLDENTSTGNNDESDLRKEKELQLDILENILGVPIVPKNKDANKDIKLAKKAMIRYDPTEYSHKEYEIDTEKPKPEIKKIKKRKNNKDNAQEANENPSVNVSKDVYFSVSDMLSKSLKEGGQFSLLKTYGKETNSDKGHEYNNVSNVTPLKPPKINFDLKSTNPFKYDSSDDEHDGKQKYTNSEHFTNDLREDTNKLFFYVNDIRFNEAEKFFSNKCASDDTFNVLRQELKQIMRSKIRRNVKKKQPWGYKRKVKKPS